MKKLYELAETILQSVPETKTQIKEYILQKMAHNFDTI